MALIACPECSKEVSDSAPSCPNCGVAIASKQESSAAGAKLTTVQETSKKLKLHILGSVVMIIIGLLFIFTPSQAENAEPSAVPFLIFTFGFIWFVVTRFRIWWHHK